MNNVIIVGRLTKDVELKATTSGVMVANFSLAVTRPFKNANGDYETDFINCVVYKASAETLARYTNKGDLIGVKGYIQTRNYTDKDGKKVYVTEVMAERISFLQSTSKKENKTEDKVYEEFGNKISLNDDDFSNSGYSEMDLPF